MEEKQEKPCCPLCHRQFNTLKEMQNLVDEVMVCQFVSKLRLNYNDVVLERSVLNCFPKDQDHLLVPPFYRGRKPKLLARLLSQGRILSILTCSCCNLFEEASADYSDEVPFLLHILCICSPYNNPMKAMHEVTLYFH